MGPAPRSCGRGRGLSARRGRRDDERRLALAGRRRQRVVAAARSSARCSPLPWPPVSASCWPCSGSARPDARKAKKKPGAPPIATDEIGIEPAGRLARPDRWDSRRRSRSSSRSGSCSGRRTRPSHRRRPRRRSATPLPCLRSEPRPVRPTGLRLVPLRVGRLDRGRRAPRAHCPPQASGDRRAAAGGRRGARIGRAGGRRVDRPDRARPRRPSRDHPCLRPDGARIRRRGDSPATRTRRRSSISAARCGVCG